MKPTRREREIERGRDLRRGLPSRTRIGHRERVGDAERRERHRRLRSPQLIEYPAGERRVARGQLRRAGHGHDRLCARPPRRPRRRAWLMTSTSRPRSSSLCSRPTTLGSSRQEAPGRAVDAQLVRAVRAVGGRAGMERSAVRAPGRGAARRGVARLTRGRMGHASSSGHSLERPIDDLRRSRRSAAAGCPSEYARRRDRRRDDRAARAPPEPRPTTGPPLPRHDSARRS